MKGASPRKAPKPGVQRPAQQRRGASVQRTSLAQRFASYRHHHRQVASESLGKLLATPLPTLMTVLVIAIALALPSGLYILIKNAQLVSGDWDGSAQISLYLHHHVSDQEGRQLAEQLMLSEGIARTQYLSRDDALEEFKALSGMGDLLTEMNENPLPAVVIVYPEDRDLELAQQLRELLADMDQVDSAQLDAEWVQRLHAMLALGIRMVWALAMALSLAVLLVITNTIRLGIESRRDEIIIIKMVGGTDTFVQRPFLYTGLWFGLSGGLVALMMSEAVLFWLEAPVKELASLYGSNYQLAGLNFGDAGILLLGSSSLGLIGAWLAVRRHLRAIEVR
jgi:cell division transport system permease protein